jgi:hypothetical protein
LKYTSKNQGNLGVINAIHISFEKNLSSLGFMLDINYIARVSIETDLIGSLHGSNSKGKIFSKN